MSAGDTRETNARETIGQRLRRLRLDRKLSQRDLAAPGVSYAYISRIEAGTRQPSVKALRRLAAKLGVSPEYLETGSDLDTSEALELRLANAELAGRLGAETDEAELEAIFGEAVRGGDSLLAARARAIAATAALERGDPRRAIELFEVSLSLYRPDPAEDAGLYGTLGNAYAAAGRSEQAAALWRDCLDQVVQAHPDDLAAQVRFATLLSYTLSETGDLERAGQVVLQALESAQDGEADPYTRVRSYWSLARRSEMEGKPKDALHQVRRAIALLEVTDDSRHLARAHILSAWIMTSVGKPGAALDQLEEAERLLGARPSADDEAQLTVERARAHAELGHGGEAIGFAEAAVELLDHRQPVELGLAQAALGQGLALEGRFDDANAAFAQAVQLLTDQRRWREATQTCQAWGRILRKAGREAEALDVLERASELGLRMTPAAALEG